MRDFFNGLVLSLGYFTRIPIPYRVEKVTDKAYGYLALTLPFSGVVLSIITVALFVWLQAYAESDFVALLVSVGYLFMYGFLHLEGFADIVDAWHGGHGGKDRYEIMKDPHIGAVGALWTFGLVLIKVASMATLLLSGAYAAVISVLILSRWGVVWVIWLGTFHEASRFIHRMQEGLDRQGMVVVTFMVAALLLFTGYLWQLPLTLALMFLLYRWLKRTFGFVNGDGLGFMIELTETVLLVGTVFWVT